MGRRVLVVAVVVLAAAILLVFYAGSSRPADSDGGTGRSNRQASMTVDLGQAGHEASRQALRDGVSPTDSGTLLETRVVDERGSAVVGAVIRSLAQDGTQQQAATTGSAGVAHVPTANGATLVTSAAGFAVSTIDMPRASTSTLLIELHREGTIAGVVVDSTGVPAGSGVFVLALPRNSPIPDGEATLRALKADPRQHLTSTDQHGRFLIHELDAAAKYSLACGGAGRLQLRPLQDVQPSQGDVELVAGWGYGEIICLVDEHGTPLPDELAHSPSRKFEVGCLDSSVLPVHSGSASGLLACPEADSINRRPACRAYLYVSPVALTNVGPNFYSSTLSGCDPLNVSFLAGPLGLPLETTTVTYRCAPEEHGSIEITFARAPGVTAGAPGEEAPSGLLVLEPRDGAAIKCPVWEQPIGPQVVSGIPFGRYQARFVAQRSSFAFPAADKPPLDVTVGKQLAHFSVELDDSGEIDIEVRDEQGDVVVGPITVDIGGPPTVYSEKTTLGGVEIPPGTRMTPNATVRRFKCAPYVLSGIAAGKHFLGLREPFRADASGVENSTIIVETGKRTKVLFAPQHK